MVNSLNKIIISSYLHVLMMWPSLEQTHSVPISPTALHTLCQTEHICLQTQHFCAMLLHKHERAFLPISASHLNYLWELNIIHIRASMNVSPSNTNNCTVCYNPSKLLHVSILPKSYSRSIFTPTMRIQKHRWLILFFMCVVIYV